MTQKMMEPAGLALVENAATPRTTITTTTTTTDTTTSTNNYNINNVPQSDNGGSVTTTMAPVVTKTTTSPTEALVVQALTSMGDEHRSPLRRPPASPSRPPNVTAISAVTPPLIKNNNSVPIVLPSLSSPFHANSTTTDAASAIAESSPPSFKSEVTVQCAKSQQMEICSKNTAVSVETGSPAMETQVDHEQERIVACLPVSTKNTGGNQTETAATTTKKIKKKGTSKKRKTTASPPTKSPVVQQQQQLASNPHPLLPVRERQVPKRLSRATRRRRLLAAPLPRSCLTHKPTLRQLQSITFADYVQKVVLGSAVPPPDGDSDDDDDDHHDDDSDMDDLSMASSTDSEDEELYKTRPIPLAEGIAKVTLPDGFWPSERTSWTAGDRTGRGPAWQAGTALGDYRIEAPIAQHVRGLAGVYEFSFVDKKPLTLAEFRAKADDYRTQVVGCAYDVFEDKNENTKKTKKSDKTEEPSDDTNHKEAPVQEEESSDYTNYKEVSLHAEDDANRTDCESFEKKQEEETSADSPKPKNVFENEEERLEYLERFFWKRLGPTMPPAWYGADHEGTLFPEDDDATGWSLGQLDSCLHVLPKVPGVTSPYLYAGMWASVFCAHSEDMNLLSINYLHAGAPKIWYAIAPGPDAQRFESLCASSFAGTPSTNGCKEFLRHKRSLLSPKVLLKAGIKFTTAIQRPGDAIITFPAGYHFGFNSGFNVAEATNFGVPEWIPYGWQAQVCLCRPDSVRIDMNRLTTLLEEFDRDQSRFRRKRLSWKHWSAHKHARRQSLQQPQAPSNSKGSSTTRAKTKRKVALSEQQKKGEFWIEVVKPLTKKAKRVKAPTPKKEQPPEPEEAGRGKRKRKLTAKAAKWEREQHRKKAVEQPPEKPSVVVEEMWHLAKPLPRKTVAVGLRVLCLLPGTTMGVAPKNQWRAGKADDADRTKSDLDEDDDSENEGLSRQRKNVTDDEEEEEEQCFTGQIVELTDDHARIHIDGLPRSEDVWMDLNENKVYQDGGRWEEEEQVVDSETGRTLPQLHYWQEMDSKRRCL